MTDTPETDECVKRNKYLVRNVGECLENLKAKWAELSFLQEDYYMIDEKFTYENPIVGLCQKLERERDDLIASLNFHADLNKELIRERDEAVSSCHIWQKGHAELVAERDYLLNLLQPNNSKQ